MNERARGESASTSINERWWVDADRRRSEPAKKSTAPGGSRFFAVAEGYDQERAKENLTDMNLRLLKEADPQEGSWAYLAFGARKCSEQRVARVKRLLALPSYARGVVVDAEGRLRLLVTGTPPGERILEMSLGEAPSFDCWIGGEWVKERLFDSEEEAIAALRRWIRRYLSPEGTRQRRGQQPAA